MSKDGPAARRGVLAATLRGRKIGVAVISNPKHIFYLTGFASNLNTGLTLMKGPRSTSFLAIDSEGRSSLLVGKTELQSPWESTGAPEIKGFDGAISTYPDYALEAKMVTYGDELGKAMRSWLQALSAEMRAGDGRGDAVGVENWHLAEEYRSVVVKVFGREPVGISDPMLDMRKTKGKDEIENLRQATKMLDFAYGVVKENANVGGSELDIYAAMNRATLREFGPWGWVLGDVVSGERSLMVGGPPTTRTLRSGETIVLDLQTACNNYWSDMCRTFIVGGRPDQRQRDAHDALLEIKSMAEDMLRPGVVAGDIHAAIDAALQKDGYPPMIHHSGHGVGLDDQESPWIIPGSRDELEEGQVIVVEPGIYTKSTGGMRTENCYLITRDGCEDLSSFPRGLG